LGLPPMSQYDASATPLWRCFNNESAHPPYDVKPIHVNLDEKNSVISKWSRMSETFNFAIEDRAPDAEVNVVIWKAVKGLDAVCTQYVHAAFVLVEEVE